jgi:hypothetical protein
MRVVCSPLEQIATLEILEISGSRAGDSGIWPITKVINANRNLKVIDFDGLYPSNSQSYTDFIRALRTCQQLRASYPEKDLNRLPEGTELKSAFVIPEDDDQETPFHLYRFEPLLGFPGFLTVAQTAAIAYRYKNLALSFVPTI